jgi:hypothetical protein
MEPGGPLPLCKGPPLDPILRQPTPTHRICFRSGARKISAGLPPYVTLAHSVYHQKLFYVQPHNVASNTSTVSLYCCYEENNCHPFSQAGRYTDGMNWSFVLAHAVCVCVCVCVCVSWVLFLLFLSFHYSLLSPCAIEQCVWRIIGGTHTTDWETVF